MRRSIRAGWLAVAAASAVGCSLIGNFGSYGDRDPEGSGDGDGDLGGAGDGDGDLGGASSGGRIDPGLGGDGSGGGGTGGDGAGGTGTGGDGAGGTGSGGGDGLGYGVFTGSGTTTERYESFPVTRNGTEYYFIANAWGPNFTSHNISYQGTSFIIVDSQGTAGPVDEPSSAPAVYCGIYPDDGLQANCGLPATIADLTSVNTGWLWEHDGSGSDYSAQYEVVISNGGPVMGYIQVWLYDPLDHQPFGSIHSQPSNILGLGYQWQLWEGAVGSIPILTYVITGNPPVQEIEFDVLDLVDTALGTGVISGDTLRAVTARFEIWNGPVTGLETKDFYVDVE